ncbi:MAG: hypothetical protein K2F78_09755 [Muribaculaceae bacterium]|nr:hypothetical protein [Muribaculaceae bacterium]
MDLNELKDKWQQLSFDSERLDSDNGRVMSKIQAGKVVSAQQRLAYDYKRNACVGFCLPALSPMMIISLHFEVWVAVAYGLFGILMAVLSLAMSRRISSVDYMSLPVVEALENVLALRRRIARTRAIGMLLGCVVLASFLGEIIHTNDKTLLWCAALGAVIGGIIGYVKYRRIKQLSDELLGEINREMNDGDA